MEFRKLGNTDIDVSLICLGTMTWGEQNSEKEAHEQLDYALDSGINFSCLLSVIGAVVQDVIPIDKHPQPKKCKKFLLFTFISSFISNLLH